MSNLDGQPFRRTANACNIKVGGDGDAFTSMPRANLSSVARVYANVNAERGPSWYEYGEVFM